MEIKNSETLDIASGKIVIDLDSQEKLLKEAQNLNPSKKPLTNENDRAFIQHMAAEILRKKIENNCIQFGSCIFSLFLHQSNETMDPLISADYILSDLARKKEFSFENSGWEPFPGNRKRLSGEGQSVPEIEVYKVTYVKPESVFRKIFSNGKNT